MDAKDFEKWLESMIAGCDELEGMEREKATYQNCLKKARKLEIKQHLTESNQEEEVITDERIESYVKDKYGNSLLKPEIIARRAIQDYRNGLPPFSKDKAVLDKPEGEEKKRTI
jgi:hypothetical protein